MNYLPVYVARVVKTSGRNIEVQTEWMENNKVLVAPLLDSLIKLPVPAVDDYVVVFQADSTNLIRFYIPIRQTQPNLTENASNTEVDSGGDTIIDGSTIYLGDSATEPGVLGNVLKTQLENLITQIALITVSTAVGPSSPILNASAISAIANTLTQILSTKVKLK